MDNNELLPIGKYDEILPDGTFVKNTGYIDLDHKKADKLKANIFNISGRVVCKTSVEESAQVEEDKRGQK